MCMAEVEFTILVWWRYSGQTEFIARLTDLFLKKSARQENNKTKSKNRLFHRFYSQDILMRQVFYKKKNCQDVNLFIFYFFEKISQAATVNLSNQLCLAFTIIKIVDFPECSFPTYVFDSVSGPTHNLQVPRWTF